MGKNDKSLEEAKGLGKAGMASAALHAEKRDLGFMERAKKFAVKYLAKNGIASGEDITDACKKKGIVPHEDRAFGAVYSNLCREEKIISVGFCARRKGHGTSGGRLWALNTPVIPKPSSTQTARRRA